MLSTIAFAGCFGSDPNDPQGSQATAAPTASAAQFDESTGALQGTVINEEGLPIVGATVGLVETGVSTITAETGEYTVSNIVPGSYAVQATLIGYEPVVKKVSIEAGVVAQANFQLAVIPIQVPFYFSDQQLGNIQCSVTWFPGAPLGDPVTGFPGDPGWYTSLQACGLLELVPGAQDANPLPPSEFDLTFAVSAGTQEFLIEQIWQSTQATGNGLSIGAEDPSLVNTGENYGSAAGLSPLIIYADQTKVLNVTAQVGIDPAEDDFEIQTRTFSMANTTNLALPAPIPEIPIYGAPNQQRADVGLAFDQKFEVWLTSFVRMEKPEGFSALPDA